MVTSPHLSPKLVVGVGSLLLTLGATAATRRSDGYPDGTPLRSWLPALFARLRRELPRGDRRSLVWTVLAAWSALVTVLHFGGIRYGIYTRLPWWDLLTHAMGGAGVAAIIAMTFRDSTLRSPAWLASGVFAIGAGFEVYEFVFKTFWYRWSVSFYVVDTVTDLLVNTSGAAAVALAVGLYRRRAMTAGDAVGGDPDRESGTDAGTESRSPKSDPDG
jgi:hypothetical protein